VAHPSTATAALAAGSYAFRASWPGDAAYTGNTSSCENFTVGKGTSTVATTLHNAGEGVVTVGSTVPLGTVMHDLATVSVTPGFASPTGSVTFTFFTNGTCDGDGTAFGTVVLDGANPGVAHPSTATAALAAGSYAFRASWPGDAAYTGNTSSCENFTVTPVTPVVTTNLSSTSITLGASVTDGVTVTGTAAGGSPTGSVTVTMYSDASCTTAVGSGVTAVLVPGGGNASTATAVGPFTPLSTGTFYFRARYNSGTADADYSNADSVCLDEQVVVTGGTLGFTPGFWGNQNGHLRLAGVNLAAVTIGSGSRMITIGTIDRSDAILSNDSCTPLAAIITCTGIAPKGLSSGLHSNTLEVLMAQTLALTYNVSLVTGYSGQTIGGLACTANLTASLTGLGLSSASTVNQVLSVANSLIGNSIRGGTTTQTQAGDLNALLGCLNRETF
jgi:hypothetical protein